jgi:hypothetical protein
MSARVSTAERCNAWNPVASHSWKTATFATAEQMHPHHPHYCLHHHHCHYSLHCCLFLLHSSRFSLLPVSLSLLAFAAIPSSFNLFQSLLPEMKNQGQISFRSFKQTKEGQIYPHKYQ